MLTERYWRHTVDFISFSYYNSKTVSANPEKYELVPVSMHRELEILSSNIRTIAIRLIQRHTVCLESLLWAIQETVVCRGKWFKVQKDALVAEDQGGFSVLDDYRIDF